MAKLQSLPFPNQLRLSRQYGMSTETIPCCQGQQWEDLLWSEAWGTFCGATLFLTHWFSTNGAYIKPVMGLAWNSINPNMSQRMSSSIKNLSLHQRSPLVCTASKAGDVPILPIQHPGDLSVPVGSGSSSSTSSAFLTHVCQTTCCTVLWQSSAR